VILGTAGHVDHGKTALVRALTGVDTDRLAEEKRRGITIELGFAPLILPGGEIIGVVDVPGHEAFVRTMLAGASGVDLALLVVAGDEGVMPQTREHLEILRLLGTQAGVVAITKVDLVDDEWLALVEQDLRDTLRGSPLATAPFVRTSVVSGAGIAALRDALQQAAGVLPARTGDDIFRMPIDRAFTVRGTGTVVTGTVWSGTLERDAQVTVLPGGMRARVRGIEMHGDGAAVARPATRAAVALAGVELHEVHRGAVLVHGEGWGSAAVLTAEVSLLESAPSALGPRQKVRFHLGTSELSARVVVAGGALAPGERRPARVVLSSPVVARAGDRFVLRSGAPLATIGGGVVHDPLPARKRVRPWPRIVHAPAERLAMLLALEGGGGLDLRALPVRIGTSPREADLLVEAVGERVVRIGDRIHGSDDLAAVRVRVLEFVDEFHQREPLEPGAPLHLLRSRLGLGGAMADAVLGAAQADGVLRVAGAVAARPDWTPVLAGEHSRLAASVAAILTASGREPPSVAELAERANGPVVPVLRYLQRSGSVVQVEGDRYYDPAVLEGMIADLRGALSDGARTPGALREALGLSRKFLIPFLEYCDRQGITDRAGDGRVLRAPPRAAVPQLDT
jgi:selenocysteine-specific elongation factor